MKPDNLEKFKKKKELRSHLSLVFISAIALYMLVSTIETIWQNYKINNEIVKLKVEIAELQAEGESLKNLIAYRGTESFKEREARRKLGYQKPGEKVLAIPYSGLDSIEFGQTKETGDEEEIKKLTNPQKWWDYIFG